MVEEIMDENQENSSDSLEGAITSSPEAMEEAQQQSQETQPPSAEQGETQEQEGQEEQKAEGKIPYERFQEVNEERKWYKNQLEKQQELINQLSQPRQPLQQNQPQDEYANLSPDEQVFWRKVHNDQRRIAQEEVNKTVRPQIEAAKQEFARLRVEQFFKDHPDVKPGSVEENIIADKVRQGYLPDDAYKVVMWGKKVDIQRQQTTQQQQQRIKAKKAANVVSNHSVLSSNNSQKKESFDEELERRLASEWNGEV